LVIQLFFLDQQTAVLSSHKSITEFEMDFFMAYRVKMMSFGDSSSSQQSVSLPCCCIRV